jgi:hypothetical protein
MTSALRAFARRLSTTWRGSPLIRTAVVPALVHRSSLYSATVTPYRATQATDSQSRGLTYMPCHYASY